MGLLDLMGSDQGLLGLSLLAAASPRERRVGLGEGLLQGLQNVQQARNAREDRAAQAEERKQRAAMQALQMQQIQAQIGETQAQAAQRMQAVEQARQQQVEAQRVQALIRAAGMPVRPIEANAASGVTGPRPEALSPVGQARPIDYQALVRDGVPMELVKALAESRNLGRDKVAGQYETTDERGNPVTRFRTEFGDTVGQAAPKPVELSMTDIGGRVVPVNRYTGAPAGQGLDKTMTPGERASNSLGWANNALSRERLTLERDNAASGKAPGGYRFKADGTLEAIPGGPADIKAGETGAKAEQRRQNVIAGANSVLDTVSDAKALVGPTTAGVGAWTANIPATPGRDLRAKLETIKANLGFDRLQQMREASPTGGALGQVAVQELNSLQATVANLDQAQRSGTLRESLDKIERHYTRWLETVGGNRERRQGEFRVLGKEE